MYRNLRKLEKTGRQSKSSVTQKKQIAYMIQWYLTIQVLHCMSNSVYEQETCKICDA